MEIGNISSVPALLRVLKDHPSRNLDDGRTSLAATTALAIATLQKVTGLTNVGTSYEQWDQWWQEDKKYYVRR
jgi:hypothetical protein